MPIGRPGLSSVCSVVLPLIFSRVFPLFFAPGRFPEDLSGDVRGRTGAAFKSDRGQSASGRPFPVIVIIFSIKPEGRTIECD